MKNKLRSMLSLAMVASMTVTGAIPSMAASTDPNASAAREAASAKVAQDAATQGMVLLENSGVLPISKEAGTKVALYGTGVYDTIKGGTGSGDVYLKDGANIDVQEGFEKAGYNIVNTEFIAAQEEAKNASGSGGSGGMFGGNGTYDEAKYTAADIASAKAATDTAIYVLRRNSGEGSDRTAGKGDYYLSDNEYANLKLLAETFPTTIVVLNVGGIIDTNFYNGKGNHSANDELNRGKIEGLDAMLLMSQAGQNGGHAVVQVLNGTVNPSGKLTDTWAVEYTDYPSSAGFSNRDQYDIDRSDVPDDVTLSPAAGNTLEEYYVDDIYVGYRYFDTYNKPVAYEFGYGLSYTDFEINVTSVKADAEKVTVQANVKNTGDVDGKEVVEVYFSAPEGSLNKPYQELAGYQKVEVAAGATKSVTVTFDTKDMSSYDESKDAYVMEDGDYIIRVGNSSRNTVEAAVITLDKDVITEQCQNNLGLTRAEMTAGTYAEGTVLNYVYKYALNNNGQYTGTATATYGKTPINGVLDGSGANSIQPAASENVTGTKASLSLAAANFETETHTYQNGEITTYVSSNAKKDSAKYADGKTDSAKEKFETVDAVKSMKGANLVDVALGNITVEQLVADMSNVELADLVEGGTYDGLSAGTGDVTAVVGSEAESVYGAAGETTSNLYISRYIPNIVMSDGPAGIRITNSYIKYDKVDTGAAYDPSQTYYTGSYSWSGTTYREITFEDEAAYKAEITKGTTLYTTTGDTYYQYCTAFPIGTMLAMTWDPEVIEMVGRAIGIEMLEYGVTSWLAPGMNIHRNPLCGRNFEYYSEDPLVCGITAAAETNGVQKDDNGNYRGIGVTLKHFAFNNQEASRMGSNSVVSERAAREIYLKGFEIGVKDAQPDYIMSSYNMVNGYSTFQNYGLLTEILRNEWGLEGFVMTDWYSIGGVRGKRQGQNVQAWLMYAGNDCEMPGGNVQNILTALEGTAANAQVGGQPIMRLGDLQRSAIKMLNVIQKSAIFDKLMDTLLEEYPELKYQSDIKDLQNMKEQLEAAANEAAKNLTELQGKLDEAENNLKALQTSSNATAEELKSAKEEITSLKAQVGAVQDAQKQIDDLKKELESSKTTSAANAEALKKAQDQVTSLQKQLDEKKVTVVTDKKTYKVKKGKSVNIIAVASDGSALKYKSNKTGVAKVSKKGKVTGKKKGTAKITITSASGAKATVTVKVKK